MWSFPVSMLGPDRNLVPGDMGDARFNNYVLEHFHAYITGRTEAYWDAPIMYPTSNTIARSDNLLGSAPLYSMFRTLGWNPESSFQLWILALFGLNFWCCFFALWKWSGSHIFAAIGAFIFAFGIHQMGHLNHVQVYPRFVMPIAFLGWWKVLEGRGVRWWYVSILAAVFQFWCGVYLGFILLYGLLVLSLAHFIVFRGKALVGLWRDRKWLWHGLIALISGGALLAPLMLPYMTISSETGFRPFDEVANSVPRPISLFFADPAAVNWRDLAWHGQNAFPEWWHQMHFMGGVAWGGVLLALGILLLRRSHLDTRKHLAILLIAWALSILLCLHVGDLYTYRLVYALPGFSALRSIDRFVMVQSFFFALVLSYAFGLLRGPRPIMLSIGTLLAGATVLDHKISVDWTKRFNKYESRQSIDLIAWQMQQQWSGEPAIA